MQGQYDNGRSGSFIQKGNKLDFVLSKKNVLNVRQQTHEIQNWFISMIGVLWFSMVINLIVMSSVLSNVLEPTASIKTTVKENILGPSSHLVQLVSFLY